MKRGSEETVEGGNSLRFSNGFDGLSWECEGPRTRAVPFPATEKEGFEPSMEEFTPITP